MVITMRTRSGATGESETNNARALKREIIRLNDELTRLRGELSHAQKQTKDTPTSSCAACQQRATDSAAGCDGIAYRQLEHELRICKNELLDAKKSLRRALEEQRELQRELNNVQSLLPRNTDRPGDSESYRLAWVGKCYLAVVLPEDYMFRPGETVTPSRVLNKLFEVRVGNKSATGFTVLLENAHILLASLDYAWYKKHFCIEGGEQHDSYRIDAEMFVWLLFEYGAHAPMIEILATHQALLLSANKCGVTTLALNTNKIMYGTYFALFLETVDNAYKQFVRAKEYALKVYFDQRHVHVPVTAGLEETGESDAAKIRGVALRSVIEDLPIPQPVNKDAQTKSHHLESLDNELAEFTRLRQPNGCGVKKQQQHAYKQRAPDDKRVIFDSDWAQRRYTTGPYQRHR